VPDITNPQAVARCNEVVRPMADRLAGLCQITDQFALQVMTPEVLGPLGITSELIGAAEMPTPEAFPDEVVVDGSAIDGRPICTRRKVLALVRVIAQLKQLKDATIYGVPRYTEAVAASLAVNPRV
jgi:hypothetical protein